MYQKTHCTGASLMVVAPQSARGLQLWRSPKRVILVGFMRRSGGGVRPAVPESSTLKVRSIVLFSNGEPLGSFVTLGSEEEIKLLVWLVNVEIAIVCGTSFWRCICLCCCFCSLWVWCEEGHRLWSDI